jgi:hypothetical protein
MSTGNPSTRRKPTTFGSALTWVRSKNRTHELEDKGGSRWKANVDRLIRNDGMATCQTSKCFFLVFKHMSQTMAAYCTILPTMDPPPHVWDIFFRLFRHKPRQLIVEYCLHWHTGPTRLRSFFHVVQTQTTTAYCRILPIHWDHHVWDIFFRYFRHKPRQLIV